MSPRPGYLRSWPKRIWFHDELLPITPTNGSLRCTMVMKSKPVSVKEQSPYSTTTSRFGCANFEAIAKPVPTPSVPSGPGSIQPPGLCGRTMEPENVTMSPPSPM